ncbi:hypothetical protein [Prosthecobacter vanneervenii]|uniref:Uncharacterized protein n=1 Tax=Prosthecobacter vanneervenii TaxID=48466 RepID=A0A7W7YFJ8_9BACT|nr:hypothetical protein [Prosthecobacter vanneervenii]MBB5034965.1 hypothetical protein [Prosthecobacter vanneervenii]
MKSVLRAFVLTALFVSLAENESLSFAGAAPTLHESQIRSWSEWWMSEAERQCLPVPQLLYMQTSAQDRAGEALNAIAWLLPAPDAFKMVHPNSVLRFKWHQANAGRIKTEAVTMPFGLEYVSDEGPEFGAYWIDWLYDGWPRHMPAFRMMPPTDMGGPYTRVKNVRAPATVRFAAFSQEQLEDVSLFGINRLNTPLEFGEAVGGLKSKAIFKSHHPFSIFDDCE